MKKNLKESIQKTVKQNILKEKIMDAPAAVAGGVMNSLRNIGGQYGLGKVQNRLDRVGNRIEKDWNDSRDEVVATAKKLVQSKNPMIAQQGQGFMRKIQGIENSVDQTLKLFDVPVDQPSQQMQMQQDPIADIAKMPENSKKQALQRLVKAWKKKNPKATVEEKVAFKQQIKSMIRGGNKNAPQAAATGIPKPTGPENEVERARRMMGLPMEPKSPQQNPVAAAAPQASSGPPVVGGIVRPDLRPKPAQSPISAASQGNQPQAVPSAQPAESPVVPPSIKGMVPGQDWGDPESLNVPKQKKEPPSSMQSPQNIKGKAAPPPQPVNPNPYQAVPPPPEPVALTKKKEEAPIPLTNLKPQAAQMPPKEKVVPSSIKGMLPPIKDDGNEIQVGSSEKPSFQPQEDNLKMAPQPVDKLKAKAERTRDPKDIKAFEKALEKDVVSQKKKNPAAKQKATSK